MYDEGLHPDCFVKSQYYPGSNPSDEVWRLDSKYGVNWKPHKAWARPKHTTRGEKARASNSTGWELYSTPYTQYPYLDSPATEVLWLIGEGPNPLPIVVQKVVLV